MAHGGGLRRCARRTLRPGRGKAGYGGRDGTSCSEDLMVWLPPSWVSPPGHLLPGAATHCADSHMTEPGTTSSLPLPTSTSSATLPASQPQTRPSAPISWSCPHLDLTSTLSSLMALGRSAWASHGSHNQPVQGLPTSPPLPLYPSLPVPAAAPVPTLHSPARHTGTTPHQEPTRQSETAPPLPLHAPGLPQGAWSFTATVSYSIPGTAP